MNTEAMKSEATTDLQAAVTRGTLRVLKIATCPSLSGKSTLTYHIGYAVDSNRPVDSGIQLRVSANTGSGFFSQEWVPMRTIRSALDEVPAGKTITSFQLHALFRGKSVNTPAFLFAVLKNEGLVEPAKDKRRQYDRIDPARFSAAVEVLMASGVDLKVDMPAKRMVKRTTEQTAKVDAKSGAKTSAQKAKAASKSARTEAKLKDAVPNVDVPRFITATPAAPAGGVTPAIPAEGAAEIAATKSTAKTATKAMKKSTK